MEQLTNEQLYENYINKKSFEGGEWQEKDVNAAFLAACKTKDLYLKRKDITIQNLINKVYRLGTTVDKLENIEQLKLQLEIKLLALEERIKEVHDAIKKN